MPNSEMGTIVGRSEPGPGFVRLGIGCTELARSIVPGQFVHIACGDPYDMFLRRPFSLNGWVRDGSGSRIGIEILARVKGRGTRWLAGLQPGDSVDVMGPLGTGFRIEAETARNVLLVAGGIGVAPLLPLAESLHDRGRDVVVLVGARTSDGLLCEAEFRAMGFEVEVTTEDGSRGRQGLVSELVEGKLAASASEIVACGPAPMLAAVARLAADHGAACQVSLEAVMGCGVGACMGCVVPASDGGRRRVCMEGPVFDAREIEWTRYVETVRRSGL